MGKKHTELYNRVFEALHADDEFVLCFGINSEEVEAELAGRLAVWVDKRCLPTYPTFNEVAQAVMQILCETATLS